jgi:sugar/nucleoside kinase (ribokinase family)
MKLTNTLLYVETKTPDLNTDTIEALQIIDAVSESFIICGLEAKSLLKFSEIENRIQNFKAKLDDNYSKGLEIFDSYKLSDNLLIVTIGDQTRFKVYVASRLNDTETQYNWHVINSTYARLGYLERQKNLGNFIPLDTLRWLKSQINRFGFKIFYECLSELKNSKVLILGESILDEYIFCDALGKVTKDPLIAFEKRSKQLQLGGVLAVARHFGGLGLQTNVISKWGYSEDEFIKTELAASKVQSFNLISSKSIRKTRYVDRSSNTRVFETYELPNKDEHLTTPESIKKIVNTQNIEFDSLVLMDYGHNFFDHGVAKDYLDFGVPISVNTQSNAGNRGFNPISNYINADIVFLNGSEVQIEMRNNVSNLEKIVTELGIKLNCKELYVTNGSNGIISWSKTNGIIVSPTFAPTIIDRTGAGDALLAAVSSLRMHDIPIEIATFFGNIAGSLLVGVMGNEKAITSIDLQLEAEKIIEKVKE